MIQLSLLLSLTLQSMRSRKFTVALSVVSIAISVFILLSVEALRIGAKSSFQSTISETDLIVGARSGSIQLLLYSVFRIGNATNNIDWRSFQDITRHPAVAWSIPISLGDSHRGYRVMGTTEAFFKHFRYGRNTPITLAEGGPFSGVYEVVIGAEVAKQLSYTLGHEIVLAHGAVDTHFNRHDDKPFKVVGILNRTGTPVDRTIHISLEGMSALHIDWQHGARRAGQSLSAEQALSMDLSPKQITAFMLGLKSKMTTFRIQRAINNYSKEPLLAILPGVALSELWQFVGIAETALFLVSVCVLVNALVGLISVIMTSLNERRRELAILRAMGAKPSEIFILLNGELVIYALLGSILGVLVYYLVLCSMQSALQGLGLYLPVSGLGLTQYYVLVGLFMSSLLLGLLPGYRAYRFTLQDGMQAGN